MCKNGIVNVDDLHGAKIPGLFPESFEDWKKKNMSAELDKAETWAKE